MRVLQAQPFIDLHVSEFEMRNPAEQQHLCGLCYLCELCANPKSSYAIALRLSLSPLDANLQAA